MKLKKLKEQVIVITGATSGIGLVTARMAAKEGARLVLAARNQETLKELSRELSQAERVPADVANEEQLRRVADHAIEKFGHFDTWVNNAGVSIYGPLMDVAIEDQRRLFETNYWGTVIGSKIAVEHLRRKGGALINLGSVLSDVSIPLQGAYSASKHAVRALPMLYAWRLKRKGRRSRLR